MLFVLALGVSMTLHGCFSELGDEHLTCGPEEPCFGGEWCEEAVGLCRKMSTYEVCFEVFTDQGELPSSGPFACAGGTRFPLSANPEEQCGSITMGETVTVTAYAEGYAVFSNVYSTDTPPPREVPITFVACEDECPSGVIPEECPVE